MRLRKCQAIKDGIVQFEGLFHRWANTGSATAAVIETKDGSVSWWLDDIKFLEPKHPLVEVTPSYKEPRQGEFHGWFQHQDEDGGSPVAIVRFDDGTVNAFPAWGVRFLELGTKEDKPVFFLWGDGSFAVRPKS